MTDGPLVRPYVAAPGGDGTAGGEAAGDGAGERRRTVSGDGGAADPDRDGPMTLPLPPIDAAASAGGAPGTVSERGEAAPGRHSRRKAGAGTGTGRGRAGRRAAVATAGVLCAAGAVWWWLAPGGETGGSGGGTARAAGPAATASAQPDDGARPSPGSGSHSPARERPSTRPSAPSSPTARPASPSAHRAAASPPAARRSPEAGTARTSGRKSAARPSPASHAPAKEETGGAALGPGAKGPEVDRLQDALRSQGKTYVSHSGVYDWDTERAVAEVQRERGITGDPPGVYGSATREALGTG